MTGHAATMAGVVKSLDKFCVPERFTKLIVRERERAGAVTTLDLMDDYLLNPSVLSLSFASVNRPHRHVYHDASLDNLMKFWKTIKEMPEADISEFNIFLGGMLFRGSGEPPLAFSVKITSLPSWFSLFHPHIGVFELIGAHMAQRVFRKWLQGFFCIAHLDNIGDCFIIVKGSAKDILSQSVTSQPISETARGDGTYWAWIGTSRNVSDDLTRMEKMSILLKAFPSTEFIDLQESDIPWSDYKTQFEKLQKISFETKAKKKQKKKNNKRKTEEK